LVGEGVHDIEAEMILSPVASPREQKTIGGEVIKKNARQAEIGGNFIASRWRFWYK
jgi:hypothetical protein